MGGTSTGAAVTTLEDAVMRIGFATLRSVALGFSLVSSQHRTICQRFDYDGFWSVSLARAVSAQLLSQRCNLGNASEAYVTGLLAAIGEMALATVHHETYGELLDMREIDPTLALTTLETDRYGIHHHEMSEAMLRDWGFPDEIAKAVGDYAQTANAGRESDSDSFRTKVQLLRAAELTAGVLTREAEATQSDLAELNDLEQRLGVPETEVPEVFESIKRAWVEWGKVLSIKTTRVRTLEEISSTARVVTSAENVPLKVLVANLPDDSRALVEASLREAGFAVLVAPDCNTALEVVLTEYPQVVVVGDRAGGQRADGFLHSVRRAQVGHLLFCIAITDAQDEASIVALLEAGVDDYIISPPNTRILVAKVRGGRRVVELQRQVADDQMKMQKQVAELAILNRKLHHASLTDALTQLPNRRSAMEHLGRSWSAARANAECFAVIMADIDHFKKVNDQFGHHVGDEVLATVGKVLRKSVRTEDQVFRLGGEEFLFICPNTDLKGGLLAAERVRRAVEGTIIQKDSFAKNVTISLGVATYEKSLEKVEDLVNRADEASYRSKTAGRNRVSVHGKVA
jgi:diguanylate cyclase (GGDEF)-like protein